MQRNALVVVVTSPAGTPVVCGRLSHNIALSGLFHFCVYHIDKMSCYPYYDFLKPGISSVVGFHFRRRTDHFYFAQNHCYGQLL